MGSTYDIPEYEKDTAKQLTIDITIYAGIAGYDIIYNLYGDDTTKVNILNAASGFEEQ